MDLKDKVIDEVLDVDIIGEDLLYTHKRKWNILNLIYGLIHMGNHNLKVQHRRLQQTQDSLVYNYSQLHWAIVDFLRELEMFGGHVRRGEFDSSSERTDEIRDRLSWIYDRRLGNLKK